MALTMCAPARASRGWTAAPAAGRPRAPLAVRAAAYGEGRGNAANRRETLLAGGALLGGLLLPGGAGAGAVEAAAPPATDSIYDLSALMFGEEVSLERYRGKVSSAAAEAQLCPLPTCKAIVRCPLHGLHLLPRMAAFADSMRHPLHACVAGADGGQRRQ